MRTANNEWSIAVFNISSRRIVTSAILTIAFLMVASANMAMASTKRSKLQRRPINITGRSSVAISASKEAASAQRSAKALARGNTGCGACAKPRKANIRNAANSAKATPCHPKGYVDPKIAKNFNSAMHDMKRAGIKPQVTSIWRSPEDQARLHNCSGSSRCRRANPGLYRALPPGQSLHEAGLAVDMSGIAAGPRGAKRLTPRGRRIVGIMQKNGFRWRYGLADPAHFEANPRKVGYRNVKQAIARSQTTCAAKIADNTRADRKPGRGPQPPPAARRTASVKQTPAQVISTKTTRHNARALAGR